MKNSVKNNDVKVNLLRSFKNLFCVLILIGLIFFQLFWFVSMRNLEISFDLSAYENFNKNMNAEEYFSRLFNYMRENPYSLNASAHNALENETLVSEIEEKINKSINMPEDVYNAYINEKISKNLLLAFLNELWKGVITLIPKEYFKPAYIEISNEGWAQITNVSIQGRIFFEEKNILFLENLNNVLGFNQSLELILSIADLVNAITEVSFSNLVNITLNYLERNGTIENSFLYYLKELIKSFDLDLILRGNALAGLIPVNIFLNISLNTIINNI